MFRNISPMQHVLVALQYEEESSYSILIKCNFHNFTHWILPALNARDRRPVCTPYGQWCS